MMIINLNKFKKNRTSRPAFLIFFKIIQHLSKYQH